MTCDAVKTMELQDSFSALFLDVEAQIPTLRFTVETKGRGGGTVNLRSMVGACQKGSGAGGRLGCSLRQTWIWTLVPSCARPVSPSVN